MNGDVQKMMVNWFAGRQRHHAVFCGDPLLAVRQLASLVGFKVMPEC